MNDLLQRLDDAVEVIVGKTGHQKHDVAVILGSGLGGYPETISDAQAISYSDIPGFPQPTVAGHAGTAYSATFGSNQVLLLSGRIHAYEDPSMDELVFAVRACIRAGCRAVFLTNAAGGCGEGLNAGDLVVLRDHLNLVGRSPLTGPNIEELGTRFPDMTEAYSSRLRRLVIETAADLGQNLNEGVYAWFLGPTYETPAEVEMARRMGADLVGMSTVPEVIAARHMGAEVGAISLVTNLAAGIADHPLSHDEVTEMAAQAHDRFTALLAAVLPKV